MDYLLAPHDAEGNERYQGRAPPTAGLAVPHLAALAHNIPIMFEQAEIGCKALVDKAIVAPTKALTPVMLQQGRAVVDFAFVGLPKAILNKTTRRGRSQSESLGVARTLSIESYASTRPLLATRDQRSTTNGLGGRENARSIQIQSVGSVSEEPAPLVRLASATSAVGLHGSDSSGSVRCASVRSCSSICGPYCYHAHRRNARTASSASLHIARTSAGGHTLTRTRTKSSNFSVSSPGRAGGLLAPLNITNTTASPKVQGDYENFLKKERKRLNVLGQESLGALLDASKHEFVKSA